MTWRQTGTWRRRIVIVDMLHSDEYVSFKLMYYTHIHKFTNRDRCCMRPVFCTVFASLFQCMVRKLET